MMNSVKDALHKWNLIYFTFLNFPSFYSKLFLIETAIIIYYLYNLKFNHFSNYPISMNI